jgi:hypothetical protein
MRDSPRHDGAAAAAAGDQLAKLAAPAEFGWSRWFFLGRRLGGGVGAAAGLVHER